MKIEDPSRLLPAGACSAPAWAWRDGAAGTAQTEALIDEEPVAFEINGIAQAVMLATPLDLEDFALGFLLTEGLIERADDLLDIELRPCVAGTVLGIQVTARCETRLRERRRSLAGCTGCGLCGIEQLDQLAQRTPAVGAALRVAPAALARAMAALGAAQPLALATGAAHAAAWCDAEGRLQIVREDVGRHIALDKLVGALVRAGIDAAAGFIAVTSRASYEMVHKAAFSGAGLLAAVSAPTQRAAWLADAAGLTLAGFVREGRATVYSHPGRVLK